MTNAKQANAPVANSDDKLFSSAGDINFPYFKFDKIGDRVKGTLVGKYQSISGKYGYTQENYVLELEDGTKVTVGGRNARKSDGVRVIYGTEKVPMGGVCGFIFEGEKDTGKGNPAKLIRIKYLGEKNMEAYLKFKDMYNLEELNMNKEEEEIVGEDPADPIPDFA